MELFVPFPRLVSVLAIALVVLILPVYGQINSPCTASMIATFTPCLNVITNSTANGTTPSAGCCSALKSLTSGGVDCACLLVTGGVPFQVPINRTLALSLPRACHMPGIPVQCKASGAPIAAPGPIAFAPTGATTSPSPDAPTLAPESDTTPLLTPPSTTVNSGAPTAATGSRSVLPPSAAMPSYSLSPSLLLFALGAVFLKNY